MPANATNSRTASSVIQASNCLRASSPAGNSNCGPTLPFCKTWNGYPADGVVWMIMTGIILHGICYDFFFVTGQIYVDKKSTTEIRSQAQGFLVFATYGVGMFIGAQLSGWVYNLYKSGNDVMALTQWESFWWVPAIFAGIILLAFAALFENDLPAQDTD